MYVEGTDKDHEILHRTYERKIGIQSASLALITYHAHVCLQNSNRGLNAVSYSSKDLNSGRRKS